MSRRRDVAVAAIVALVAFALVVRARDARRLARVAAGAARDERSPVTTAYEDAPYATLHSLAEARTMEHTAAIARGYADGAGDAGAQIDLTVPVKYVACDEATLRALLGMLDRHASLTFELAPIGSGVSGEPGGGEIVDGLWLNPRFARANLAAAVEAVVYGRSPLRDVLGAFPESLT